MRPSFHPRRARRIRIALAALALLAGAAPVAAQRAPAAHVELDSVTTSIRIHADATSTRTHRIELKALTRDGTAEAGRQTIQFNRDVESVEIVEAYTAKADGTRIPVAPSAIATQVGLAVPGALPSLPGVSMPSIELRQLTFPDLGPGDRSVAEWTVRRHRPELPGFARFEAVLLPGVRIRQARYRIEAPASLALAVDIDGLRWTQRREADTEIWEIEGTSAPRPLDPATVDAWTYLPRVLASTFPDLETLAAAYGRAVDAKAVPTEATRALARRIVGDRTTDEAKAAAIHDWIRANLRYTAIWIGTDGWVPHDVDAILRDRYGDCKDLSLLMIALLRAVDVEAVPALITTAPAYTPFPVGLGPNHVIVHLPTLGRFADPTAADVPFGALPQPDLDKPVAVALAGGAKRMRTPAGGTSGENANTLLVASQWKIARDGAASATIDLSARGPAAEQLKAMMLRAGGADAETAAGRILASSKLEGRGRLDWPTREAHDGTQRLRLDIAEVRGLVPDPQAASLPPHPMLDLPVYALRQLGDLSLEQRRTAIACPPGRIRETFEVAFDPAYRLRRVPEPVRITHEDGIVFEASYAVEGDRLVGWRELSFDHGRQVCSPEQYGARRETLQRIARHLRASLLVEQP